jgi:uncharacterized protein (DUF1684 family)
MLKKTRPTPVAVVIILLASAVLFARTTGASPVAPDAAYEQSFEKWKAEQIDDLKQNWLPLAGLYWLKPGVNSFGTAAENAVVFPKGPAHAGEFDLDGKDVTIKMLPDAHATAAGKPLATARLDPDISGHASLVEMGSLRFHVIVRGERVGIRVKDLESAAIANFKGLIFYPLDLNYRVTATWEPSDGKKMIDVPNVLGDVTPVPVAGTVVFKIDGQEQRLTALGGEPSIGLSFVFNDLTAKNGEERYLSRWALSGQWSRDERNRDSGFQSGVQPAVRGNSLCNLSVGAEGEPAGRGNSCGREV